MNNHLEVIVEHGWPRLTIVVHRWQWLSIVNLCWIIVGFILSNFRLNFNKSSINWCKGLRSTQSSMWWSLLQYLHTVHLVQFQWLWKKSFSCIDDSIHRWNIEVIEYFRSSISRFVTSLYIYRSNVNSWTNWQLTTTTDVTLTFCKRKQISIAIDDSQAHCSCNGTDIRILE